MRVFNLLSLDDNGVEVQKFFMEIIKTRQFFENKDFESFSHNVCEQCIKYNIQPFIERSEEIESDFNSYFTNMITEIIENPEKLITQSKFYSLFLRKSVMGVKFLKKREILFFEIAKSFFQNSLLGFIESNVEEIKKDDIRSLEKLIISIFDCLISEENGFRKIDLCEFLVNQGVIEKFEKAIIEKKSTFALMVLKNFLNVYQTLNPELKEYRKMKETEFFENILSLNEFVIFKMENIEYDLGENFKDFLQIKFFEKEKDLERLGNCCFVRYLIKRTNGKFGLEFDSNKFLLPKTRFSEIFHEYQQKIINHAEKSKILIFASLKKTNHKEAFILINFLHELNYFLLIENLSLLEFLQKSKIEDFKSDHLTNSVIFACCSLYCLLGNGQNLTKIKVVPEFNLQYFVISAKNEIEILFEKMINLKNPKDQKLVVQFYQKGLLEMDFELKNVEENLEKCLQMKKVEFFMIMIKKCMKKNLKFYNINTLENELFSFAHKVLPIFDELLNCYLKISLEIDHKIEETKSFFDLALFFHSNIGPELKSINFLRIFKVIFLFFKGFWNLEIDSISKITNFLINSTIQNLEITLDFEKLTQKNEKSEIFLLILLKHQIYLKLLERYSKNPMPIFLKSPEFLETLKNMNKNIMFFQKLLECFGKVLMDHKIEEEIKYILKTFYFQFFFVNIFMHDLNSTEFQNDKSIHYLKDNLEIIKDFCKINFSILQVLDHEKEFSQFSIKNNEIDEFLKVYLKILIKN